MCYGSTDPEGGVGGDFPPRENSPPLFVSTRSKLDQKAKIFLLTDLVLEMSKYTREGDEWKC
jgi:hypothetical protein